MGVKHTERVVELCERFSEELGVSGDERKLLLESAELHDKFKGEVDDCRHSEAAAVYIIENGKTICPESAAHIVRAHNGEFNPPIDLWYLAAILRMSDKLDKFSKKKAIPREAHKKCKNNWDEIECWYSEQSEKDDTRFMRLMRVYRGILKEYLSSE